MELINPSKYIKKNKFNPSKKMGQNFLIDQNIINHITAIIQNYKCDAIIEIGPGLGAITKNLCELNLYVHLIEVDKRLFEYLNEHYKDRANVKLYCKDVLKFNLDSIAKQYKNCIIVSNLPYSISSLVIIQFLQTKHIQTMFCMLQKELVDRMLAKPHTAAYNSFSVLMQQYTNIERLIDVGNNCFVPPPEVKSNFIKIDKKLNVPFDVKFNKFIKLIFSSKRKTLYNNLKSKYSKEQLIDLYKNMKLDKNTRAEELSYSDIKQIYKYIEKNYV